MFCSSPVATYTVSSIARITRSWLKMEHISDFLSTTMAAVLPSRPSPPTRGTPTPSSQNWTRSHTLGSVQLQLSNI